MKVFALVLVAMVMTAVYLQVDAVSNIFSCYIVTKSTGWSKKVIPLFEVCDNFRKCTLILTIFFHCYNKKMYDV